MDTNQYVRIEGDINNDGILDKIFYSNSTSSDSMHIFLSSKRNVFNRAYSGENFSEDGILKIDTILINQQKQNIEIHLKEIRFERLEVVYRINYSNNSFYLINIQTVMINPKDNYIEKEICDTAFNIGLKESKDSISYFRDKINNCITTNIYY